MINENILSMTVMVFLILSGLVILKLTSRIKKTISQRDETYPNEFNVSSKFFKKKNNIYKLVEGHEPFKWRVGLALSLASLDKNSEKKFLSSLSKVLKEENYVVQNRNEPRALRRILPPVHHKKIFNGVTHYSDLYAVKRIMDGSTDTETLRYILELNIEEFITHKRTRPTGYTVGRLNPFEPDEDPFNQEEPF